MILSQACHLRVACARRMHSTAVPSRNVHCTAVLNTGSNDKTKSREDVRTWAKHTVGEDSRRQDRCTRAGGETAKTALHESRQPRQRRTHRGGAPLAIHPYHYTLRTESTHHQIRERRAGPKIQPTQRRNERRQSAAAEGAASTSSRAATPVATGIEVRESNSDSIISHAPFH